MFRLLLVSLLVFVAQAQICPIDVCEEDVKNPICMMDSDGNYNRICVYVDDIPTYFANGGFDPSDRLAYDCDCNLLFAPTESPTTSAPTEAPTEAPTDAPVEAPTDAPTRAPTEAPTQPDTGVIGDSVFEDLNGNGIQDPGEPGIFGVYIHLINDVDGDGFYDSGEDAPAVDSMGNPLVDITNFNGEYRFDRLPGDDYLILIEDPNNVLDGLQVNFPGNPPDGDTSLVYGDDVVGYVPVTIADGEENLDEDLAFEPIPEEEREICMDVVPDEPDRNFRCIMDSNFNVDLAIVDLTDTFTLDWYFDYFPLGSEVDVFGISLPIYWDCWCHAHCPWPSMHDHMFVPEFLVGHSWFYDDILHLTVAIPNTFDMGTQFFFQDVDGNAIPVGDCDTTDMPSCTYWTQATDQEYFRHNCYTAYYTDIPLSQLTPYYDPPHEVGTSQDPAGWMVTYYGLLVSQSLRDMGMDVRGVPETFSQRSVYKWQLTFPLQVEAHVEDIRVYDEVNKVDGVISAEVNVEDFGWGFSWGMYDFWGEVVIRTSVQWPFRLDLESAIYRPNDGDILVFFQGVNNAGCPDPGIGDYGDAAFVASATTNQLAGGEFIPDECVQVWGLRLEAGVDTVCTFDGYYDLAFDVSCQPSYAGNCPLDERYDAPLNCEFWLSTENFCDEFSETVTVAADIDSYSCTERTCSCEENNFIETFVNQNDETAVENVYFELNVMSSEPLEASELRTVTADVICDNPPISIMTDVYSRFSAINGGWDVDLIGAVDNYPDAQFQCGGGSAENTINFEFDLPPDFFHVPLDDSCHLSVWATVDLWYRGVQRPDGLVPSGSKKMKLLEVDYDGDVLAFGENPTIVLSTTIQLSDGVQGVEVHELPPNDLPPVIDGSQPVNNQKAGASRLVPFLCSILFFVSFLL